MNKKGYRNVEEVINSGMTALSPAEFETVAEASGAVILDTRDSAIFLERIYSAIGEHRIEW
jgi:hydroxyacylglutathione hydrolase